MVTEVPKGIGRTFKGLTISFQEGRIFTNGKIILSGNVLRARWWYVLYIQDGYKS